MRDEPDVVLGLSVWPCAQQVARFQRAGRYLPGSTAHPGKMLPALARHAIAAYTRPDDLVLDPMCGIGTTLVEAAHLGRMAIGIEYECRWADLARDNLALATDQGATGAGEVILGDARYAPARLSRDLRGRCTLLLTSPPYADSNHGTVTTRRDTGQPGIRKRDWRYGSDTTNLAYRSLPVLLDGFTDILTACRPLLRPDATVVITTRAFRRNHQLLDFPSLVLQAAQAAGLQPVQRCVALLAGLRNGGLVTRASFFQQQNTAQSRRDGLPLSLIAHEDVAGSDQSVKGLVFRPEFRHGPHHQPPPRQGRRIPRAGPAARAPLPRARHRATAPARPHRPRPRSQTS